VRGKTGPLDKMPWKNVDVPRGPVEAQFLRGILLGEGIAPFRVLRTALGVIPAEEERLFDGASAREAGYRHLATWMREIESKWEEHCSKRADGRPRMTLEQQFNHMRKLSAQLSTMGTRLFTRGPVRCSAQQCCMIRI
jgi:hypothetical protein